MSQLHRFLRASRWTLFSGIIAALFLQGCAHREAVCFAPDDPVGGATPFVYYVPEKNIKNFDVIGFFGGDSAPKGQAGCTTTPTAVESAQGFLLLEGTYPYTLAAVQPAGSQYVCKANYSKCASPGSICSRVNGTKYCKHAVLKSTDPAHSQCMCACKP